MSAQRSSTQEILTWGTMLDQEPPDVSRRAQDLFKRAKSALSLGSGHTISGISGNDKALACICLCIEKNKQPTRDRKAIETSLQRTSGVQPRIFSNALQQLPLILYPGSVYSSPSRKSPSRRHPIEDKGTKNIVGGSASKDQVARIVQDSGRSLIKSSPLKRVALTQYGSDDELMISPSRKKKMRISETIPSPSKKAMLGSDSQTPHLTPTIERHSNTRTIHKTPLDLPIKKPPKPMCIFQSQPVLNLEKHEELQLNFSDWNWKSNLFRLHWSLDEIYEWEKWNKKSIESSLS